MNVVHAIDKQITEYLDQLSMPQKKAVLGIVKALATGEDDDFEKEMNRRIADFESGAAKCYTFEESAQRARQAYEKSKTRQ